MPLFFLLSLQRRLTQKEQLNLSKYATDSDQEEEHNGVAKKPHVKMYTTGGLTSTVIVAPIKVNSDSEPEGNNTHEEYSDDDVVLEMPAAAQARKMEKEKQRAKDREKEEEARRNEVAPTKLSKTSLRVMLKTKAKIAGKKTVGRKAAGLQPGKKGGGADRGGDRDRSGKGNRKGRR